MNILNESNKPLQFGWEIGSFVQNAIAGVRNTNIQPIPGKVVGKHDAGALGAE